MSRSILKLFFALFLFTGILFSQSNPDYKPVTKFDPSRNPADDVAEAVEEAERTDKRIILDVGGDWCIWCHRLDDFINKNDEINSLLHKNFIVVKINFSKENKNEDFLSQYPQITGYPHLYVLDKDGEFLHSQNTGELEEDKGYSKEKMISFLKKWASKK
jgi:thioredoxin-related protein